MLHVFVEHIAYLIGVLTVLLRKRRNVDNPVAGPIVAFGVAVSTGYPEVVLFRLRIIGFLSECVDFAVYCQHQQTSAQNRRLTVVKDKLYVLVVFIWFFVHDNIILSPDSCRTSINVNSHHIVISVLLPAVRHYPPAEAAVPSIAPREEFMLLRKPRYPVP